MSDRLILIWGGWAGEGDSWDTCIPCWSAWVHVLPPLRILASLVHVLKCLCFRHLSVWETPRELLAPGFGLFILGHWEHFWSELMDGRFPSAFEVKINKSSFKDTEVILGRPGLIRWTLQEIVFQKRCLKDQEGLSIRGALPLLLWWCVGLHAKKCSVCESWTASGHIGQQENVDSILRTTRNWVLPTAWLAGGSFPTLTC